MIDARDLFVIGQRVKTSGEGFLLIGRTVFGNVVGYGRDVNCIRIKRDDKNTVQTYHADFWVHEPSPSGDPQP